MSYGLERIQWAGPKEPAVADAPKIVKCCLCEKLCDPNGELGSHCCQEHYDDCWDITARYVVYGIGTRLNFWKRLSGYLRLGR